MQWILIVPLIIPWLVIGFFSGLAIRQLQKESYTIGDASFCSLCGCLTLIALATVLFWKIMDFAIWNKKIEFSAEATRETFTKLGASVKRLFSAVGKFIKFFWQAWRSQ